MAYLPIQDYGLIGNMRTVALVGRNGSIDWFCYPHFDSPSIFAAILDDEKGGRFEIAPTAADVTEKQLYWPDTNVLVSRFLTEEGVGQVVDFMPVELEKGQRGFRSLVRQVRVVRGEMNFKVECRPAFNYGRDEHETSIGTHGAIFTCAPLRLGLFTEVELEQKGGGVVGEFCLAEGKSVTFILQEIEEDEDCEREYLSEKFGQALFVRTVEYWRHWIGQCSYRGRWRETVLRSALVLKLLTFEPTGAIVAAPTCSLPELVGGSRNWDYRYTWLRDAAFTLYGLMRIGFTQEAARFMQWLSARIHELEPDGSLQIMYGIDGRHRLDEEELDHFEGYRGSRPVRIGNEAYQQLQLDIYGELMDSIYLYNKYGEPISYDLWCGVRRILNWLSQNWQRPDDGIWEVRSGPQHFVYSKLMCWVAFDRGLRLAEKRSFPADYDRWLQARDAIFEEIMEKGWNADRESFVQTYGGDTLDASLLSMSFVFFLSSTDPRLLKTIDAINRSPADGGLVSNSLVYRYDVDKTPDGVPGREGTFNICTFWLVEALTRAGRIDRRRLDEARLLFEQMLGHASHLGLYGEETGPRGEALGNFPQAFTHLSLISAAFNLDRALGAGD
jgi:GH15 family glucan-1,4-alpha-glucosidase